jgi:hypothetical protein
MPKNGAGLVPLALWTALAGLSLLCMALRIAYPFALEWMEGNEWYFGFRIATGLPVYGDPNTIGFIPHPYPPLFGWMSAAFIKIFGAELWPARLVSILFTAIATSCIGRAVCRSTRSRPAAWLGACMFLGLYGVLDTWYDLIRGDIVYTSLTLAAFTLWAERPASSRHVAGALGLLAVASLAKQTAVIVLAFASLHGLVSLRRPLPIATGIGVCFVLHAALHFATAGWSTFWIWEVPARHAVQWGRFVPGGVARTAWIVALPLAVVAVHGFANRAKASGHARRRFDSLQHFELGSIWGTALLASFVAGAISYSKVGSGINNLILLAAVTCIVTACAFGKLLALTAASRAGALAAGLLVGQAALSIYDPRAEIPTSADRAAGDALVETIRGIPGEVHVLDDASLAHRAGEQPSIGGMAIGDLAYAGHPAPEALLQRLRHREFAALVLRYDPTDPKHTQPVPIAIRENYGDRKVEIEYAAENTFIPMAGGRYRPQWIVYRRDRSSP